LYSHLHSGGESFLLEQLINSFLLVFVGEIGDKTQLLALLLASRYQKYGSILAGVFTATILNHALASWVGLQAAQLIPDHILKWVLAGAFFAFAIWVLIPDKETDIKTRGSWSVFAITFVSFFLAEMGDKTQLVTVALGAKYSSVVLVSLGSTLGMMASNGLAIFWGPRILQSIPIEWVRRLTCMMMCIFGLLILLS
jgi:putative Ca2+/H+ antiporter (TMEM165/GDT1 family)